MSFTQTVTLTPLVREEIFEVKPRFPQKYRAALEQLSSIAALHEEWTDPLSTKMHAWSLNMIDSFELLETIDAAADKSAVERVIHLATNILKNPYGPSVLKEPVLEGSWTCEKRDYEACRDLGDASPPWASDREWTDAKTHVFATMMLAWIYSLVPDAPKSDQIVVQGEGGACVVMTAATQPLDCTALATCFPGEGGKIYAKNLLRTFYSVMTQSIIKQREDEFTIQRVEAATKRLELRNRQIEIQLKADEARMREQRLQHKQQLMASLLRIKQTWEKAAQELKQRYEGEIDHMAYMLRSEREARAATEARVSSLSSQVSAQAREINSADQRLNSLRSDQAASEREIDRLRNSSSSSSSNCIIC